jgi:hypothetical protein
VFQAGALLALIGGAVVAMPSAALAADPSVVITNLTSGNLQAGQRATLRYRVTNNNPAVPGSDSAFTIVVNSTLNELTCDGNNCNFNDEIPAGQSKEYTVTLVGGAMPSGQSKAGQIQIRATVGDDERTASRPITVRGDDRSPTVREVAGRVRDEDGKAISNAQVGLTDSQNHQYTTNTNGSGNFRFTSSDDRPIVPGPVTVGARKDGYQIVTQNVTGQAGRSLNVSLTMRSTAAPSPSATPSASATATEEATDDVTAETTPAPTLNAAPAAGDSGSGSLLFIIVGGLLVAAGVGAIVLVLMRRRNEAGNDPDDAGGAGGVAAVPPSQGRWDSGPNATRIGNRNGADATMLAGVGARPTISDAPTMLQQAVPVDEFADPYGAPSAVPHTGYPGARPGGWAAPPTAAGAAGTYGAPATPGTYGAASAPGGYDGAPQPEPYGAGPDTQYGRPPAYGAPAGGADPYGQPSGPAGYGAAPESGGGYGSADQRYDEPTGRYDPATNGGYRGDPGYEQGSGYRSQDVNRSQDVGGPGFPTAGGYPGPEPDYPPPARQHPGSGAPYQGSAAYQGGGGYQAAPAGGEQAGYGSWSPGGGIDSGNAYGAPAGTYGRAGAPAGGAYEDPTGYDPRGSYGRGGGYDRAPDQPSARPAGRAPQGGGFDDRYYGDEPSQGGRHGGQPPSQERGQRRPLDWLDD